MRAGHVREIAIEVQVALDVGELHADRPERARDLVHRRGDDRRTGTVAAGLDEGRRAAVPEDRRADDLRPRVVAAGRREQSAHAFGGDDQALAPGWALSVWAVSRTSGTALAQPTPTTWYLSVAGAIA